MTNSKFIATVINNYNTNYKLVDTMSVIYENGQVVIPKHLREKFNLHAGTHVRFIAEEDGLKLKTDDDVLAEFRRLSALGDTSHEETERLIKETDEQRKRELSNVS